MEDNNEEEEEEEKENQDEDEEEDKEEDDEEDPEKKGLVPTTGDVGQLEKRYHEHEHDRDHYFDHEGHHGHHEGEHDEHHGEHGHHHHDHHEHDHHHHDHGYEFYEEWGEHGGHEGEHHGHDEGGHHGEHHGHHKGHGEEEGFKKTLSSGNRNEVTPGSDTPDASKKWWMVGDHWGGWGKDHWGCPHIEHEAGGWQYCHHGLRGNQHGTYKSIIPACCKFANPSITKRCGCGGGGAGGAAVKGEHAEAGGYHFHDHGSGHNNHDHDLQGAWTFGYDHFGDDWHDWDHNNGNFAHLQHMDHGCRCGHGRACVPLTRPCTNQVPVTIPIAIAPAAAMQLYRPSGYALNALNPVAQAPRHQNRVYHVCHDCQNLPYGGSRCLCKNVRRPVNSLVPQYQRHMYIDCDSAVHRFPFQANCVARADIPVPKDKTEKGNAKQGVVYPYVGYGPWAAYPWTADWWGGQGHHGWAMKSDCDREHSQGHCRDDIVLGHHGHHEHHHEHHSHHEHHGHHGHHHHGHHHEHHGHHHHGHHHEHHGHHHHGHHHHGHHHEHHGHHHHEHHGHHHHGHHHHGHHHEHHHEHHGHHHHGHHHHGHHSHHHHGHHSHHHHGHHGHHFISNTPGPAEIHIAGAENKNIMGLVNGRKATAYHCHDVVDKTAAKGSKAKRFCVPIGYHGGYNWPYYHGYPGVGTGLWGWGWPWIKNKVPGSTNKPKAAAAVKAKASEPAASPASTKTSTRSLIPAPNTKEVKNGKSTKKQTIHVGYGYASGDNYRLGYGYGGMGGVAGFSPNSPSAEPKYRSNIPKNKDKVKETVKTNIPTPETTKDVTASKRNIGYNQPTEVGSLPGNLGHPVTHPGFTTVGFPGHGDSQTEVIKDKIPANKQTNADKRVL